MPGTNVHDTENIDAVDTLFKGLVFAMFWYSLIRRATAGVFSLVVKNLDIDEYALAAALLYLCS